MTALTIILGLLTVLYLALLATVKKIKKVVKLEGKGHMLNWEAADELVTEMIDLAK